MRIEADSPCEPLVARGQRGRELPDVAEDLCEVAFPPLEDVEDGVRDRVDVLGVGGLNQWAQVVEDNREVQGRVRVLHGDRVSVGELLRRGFTWSKDVDHSLTEQVEELDLDDRVLRELDVAGDLHRDVRLAAVDLEARDLPHENARDLDRVAVEDTGRIGEHRIELVGVVERRQLSDDGRQPERDEDREDREHRQLRRHAPHRVLLPATEDWSSPSRSVGADALRRESGPSPFL